MVRTETLRRIGLALVRVAPALVLAQPQLDPETVRRQAAADFVMAQAVTLGILRQECRQWLAGSGDDVERVAMAWWQQHRDELDAANWIVLKEIERHKATLTGEAAVTAERQTLFAPVAGAMTIQRALFNRELPTADSCRRAVRQYAVAPGQRVAITLPSEALIVLGD